MSYGDEMDEYYEEKIMKKKYKATYNVPAGTYESDSLMGLVWEVFKHRCWHLWKHKRWMD